MEIIANGESHTVPPGTTLAAFLESLDLASPKVAVEHNGAIVPRERYDAVTLSAGDRLEVVTLVGGG